MSHEEGRDGNEREHLVSAQPFDGRAQPSGGALRPQDFENEVVMRV